MGAYSKGGGLFEGDLNIFLVVGRWKFFLLVNYFVDATHTSNRMHFKGQGNLRYWPIFLSSIMH